MSTMFCFGEDQSGDELLPPVKDGITRQRRFDVVLDRLRGFGVFGILW